MKRKKSSLLTGRVLIILAALSPFFLPGCAAAEEHLRIRLLINGKTLFATLEDSPAGRDFRAMLPISLTLKDFNDTEKIANLPRRILAKGAPDGYRPLAGDLAFYVPWGNLCIFYRDFSWSAGLIRIGRITSDMQGLSAVPDGATVRIEQAR